MSTRVISPITLRRAFLLSLRTHYSDPAHFGHYQALVGGLCYADGPDSVMDIELMHVYDPAKLNSRPAIYLGFRPQTYQRLSGDGGYAGTSDDGASSTYLMSTTGQMLVRHVAPVADMALLMGEISAEFFFGMRPLFMQQLCLRQFDLASLSDPRVVEKAPDRMIFVDLVCTLNYTTQITTSIESHRLKKVVFEHQFYG